MVAGAAAGALLVVGCTGGDDPSRRSGSTSAGSGKDEASTIAEAERLADSYDYPEAKKLLRPLPSRAARSKLAEISAKEKRAEPVEDPSAVTHVFYHSLVVDTGRAFRGDHAKGYKDYMVTAKELGEQLEQMRERGYVLVHPHRLFDVQDGSMEPRTLRLPRGKKPLVLSIDDVSYYSYADGHGFASDLFVAGDGRVRNHYTDAKGRTHVGAFDVSTVLDDFVREHPDFSYRGDKGTMALTGYEGVLGYRTSLRSHGNTAKTRQQITQAKKVATALRKDGWKFASHSWGHLNFTDTSLARIKADSQRWDREVRPVIGDTDQFIYPFGADIAGPEPYSRDNAKYRHLRERGFRYFFPVDGSSLHWVQPSQDSLRMARINIDGLSLTRASSDSSSPLHSLFDPATTQDPAR